MRYETVIGLEVHAELDTQSKIFCSCSAQYGAAQNMSVCPACAGMPGMLPIVNRRVVELAMTAGFLTHCTINRHTTFDKKSYFYPDLPNAYQITQWFAPICTGGYVDIETAGGARRIGIKQIHMEEDAGKLLHDEFTDTSLIDFNRTGVPLIEIVSEPDLKSAEDVGAYLEKLRSLLRFADVSKCRWEEGSMRCDVNLSVRPEGSSVLGVRTELKNMNSLSAIARAIEFETARHIDALEAGHPLVQETRRWDDLKGRSYAMRGKETAADYRYFPDPNLAPIVISDAWHDEIKATLPESAEARHVRFQRDMGIAEADSAILTSSRALSELFEAAALSGGHPQETAGMLVGEYMNLTRTRQLNVDDVRLDAGKLGVLIQMLVAREITRSAARRILVAIMDEDADPRAYCQAHGLLAQSDESVIAAVTQRVIDQNPKMVADYKKGKVKIMQALFGLIMRELKGNGDPAVIQRLLGEALARE